MTAPPAITPDGKTARRQEKPDPVFNSLRGPAGALWLFEELLPGQARVLGFSHPDTLTTRGKIASWTEVMQANTRRRPSDKRTPGDPRMPGTASRIK